jgi:hypothetical protein
MPTSTRRPAGLTAPSPAFADPIGGSLNAADDTLDPGLTGPAGNRLTTSSPAVADSVGRSLNTADHAVDGGANHSAGHLCGGIGHPGCRFTHALSGGQVRVCHQPVDHGKGSHCAGLRRSRRLPRRRFGRARVLWTAPFLNSIPFCKSRQGQRREPLAVQGSGFSVPQALRFRCRLALRRRDQFLLTTVRALTSVHSESAGPHSKGFALPAAPYNANPTGD